MALWLKILIIVLALHYVLAIAVIFFVLKDNLNGGVKVSRTKLICWNLFVLLIPILGPLVYCIYRFCTKSKMPPSNTTPTEHIDNSSIDTNTTTNASEKTTTDLDSKDDIIKNEDK